MGKILITLLVLLPFGIKAQGVFGADHKSVRDTMTKYGFVFEKTDKRPDGTVYDDFSYANGGADGREDAVCYFNKQGICYQYRRILPIATLIENLEHLNKNYTKVDDVSWVNKKNTVKVYISINDILYYISYISMEISDE